MAGDCNHGDSGMLPCIGLDRRGEAQWMRSSH